MFMYLLRKKMYDEVCFSIWREIREGQLGQTFCEERSGGNVKFKCMQLGHFANSADNKQAQVVA